MIKKLKTLAKLLCGGSRCMWNAERWCQFGLLFHVPWNVYQNWIYSNECSDANYREIWSGFCSGPTAFWI